MEWEFIGIDVVLNKYETVFDHILPPASLQSLKGTSVRSGLHKEVLPNSPSCLRRLKRQFFIPFINYKNPIWHHIHESTSKEVIYISTTYNAIIKSSAT